MSASGHKRTLRSQLDFYRRGGEHVVGRHGAADAFERKIANGFDGHGVFDRQQDTRTNQDLPGLGFVAEPEATFDTVPMAA